MFKVESAEPAGHEPPARVKSFDPFRSLHECCVASCIQTGERKSWHICWYILLFLVEFKYIKIMFIEKDFTLDEPGKANIDIGDGENSEMNDSPTKEK